MIFTESERETIRRLILKIANEWHNGNRDDVINEILSILENMTDEEKRVVIKFIIGFKKYVL